MIEGAPLEGADRGHAAITIRAATADEVFDFLAKKYDLTRRERQLVALMLDGLATKQLAAVLCISPHTVLDHLKSILATTQLRSRRELLSYLAGRLPQADPRARRGLTRSNTRLGQCSGMTPDERGRSAAVPQRSSPPPTRSSNGARAA